VRPSRSTCYCRPGNPQALRTAHSCDVQEHHTSGVQLEQVEYELKRSWVTATVIQGRASRQVSCAEHYNTCPGQERVKGNELAKGHTMGQASRWVR
jgi:hypothetical protein